MTPTRDALSWQPRVREATPTNGGATVAIMGFVLVLLGPGPTTAVVALGFEGLACGLPSGGCRGAIGSYLGLALALAAFALAFAILKPQRS